MGESKLSTIRQIEAFLGASEQVTFAAHAGDTERYAHISTVLRRFDYQVVVSDTGPGIADEDVPHLFDRFYQARESVAPSTGTGGKGLGLAIAKRIAELHGGAVRVDSAKGRGTQLTLLLPAGHEGVLRPHALGRWR